MYPLKRATTPFGDDKTQELSHFAYIKYLFKKYIGPMKSMICITKMLICVMKGKLCVENKICTLTFCILLKLPQQNIHGLENT